MRKQIHFVIVDLMLTMLDPISFNHTIDYSNNRTFCQIIFSLQQVSIQALFISKILNDFN